MKLNYLRRFIILELEEYWNFPVFEFIVFTALIALLNGISSGIHSHIHGYGLIYQILIVSVMVSRSFAGSINRREIITLLSYPVKRWKLLLSKIITTLFMIFIILAFSVSLNIPLLGLSPLNPDIYVAMAIMFTQLLYLCTVAMTISIVLKNEVLSIFTFILLLFGLEFSLGTSGAPYRFFTLFGGNEVMFRYITFFLHPKQLPPFVEPKLPFTFQEFTIALGYPLLTSAILLAILFAYFQWVMQID